MADPGPLLEANLTTGRTDKSVPATIVDATILVIGKGSKMNASDMAKVYTCEFCYVRIHAEY